jgi:Rps23 Pro-64 3,4-dihydroxylase Tpa1-like proline 4-hydroxylase
MNMKLMNDVNLSDLSKSFINAKPFHHIVIDNFLDTDFAKRLGNNFPSPFDKNWWMYDNQLEKKLAFNDISELDDSFKIFFEYVNSEEFLFFLEKLTVISGLKPDSSLRGGGLHLIKQGGKLDIHEDFNIHKEINMLRKVNLILYLNENWQEEWGGHLELWDKDMQTLHQKILPIFNRAVIFRTDMDSNHGHPHPLTCPENQARISLATYYYVEDPNIENIPYKSTTYKKLPGLEDGLDELRSLRQKGRLQNLTSK